MKKVIVCDKCLTASCWQDEFHCDDYRHAGTVEMEVEELIKLNLENPRFWEVLKDGKN